MGADTKIQWAHHTFNPWRGCTKVSDGCKFCYADTLSKRNPKTLGVWGPNGTRVVAAESAWREPLKWNTAAKEAGERHRVFCASLADVFEANDTMPAAAVPCIRGARLRLFELISITPHLDWLLLTKRPENVRNVIEETLIMSQGGDPDDKNYFRDHDGDFPSGVVGNMLNDWSGEDPPHNVWLGTSVEDQARADERIPHLLKCPAVVRFLSCEPLLGALDLRRVGKSLRGDDHDVLCGWRGTYQYKARNDSECSLGVGWASGHPKIDWVIVGGESGPRARPCNVEWIRSIVSQCKAAGVACFVKQLGAELREPHWTGAHEQAGQPSVAWMQTGWPTSTRILTYCDPVSLKWLPGEVKLKDKKGGDPAEWPADLRVRELPAVPAGVSK